MHQGTGIPVLHILGKTLLITDIYRDLYPFSNKKYVFIYIHTIHYTLYTIHNFFFFYILLFF